MPSNADSISRDAFILLCSEKGVRDSGDNGLERAFQSLSLKRHLDNLQTQGYDMDTAYLPGAGAAYKSGCVHHVLEDRWLSLFVGNIENYAYLVKKYCLEEAGFDRQGACLLETVRALSTLNDAHVVALLFKKLGPTFMAKVKGEFAFAIYDAELARVLAVSDRRASHPLWQAQAPDASLLAVGAGLEPPSSLQLMERVQVGAGEFKFGWRAAPQAYMASTDAVVARSSEARSAAMQALASASIPIPADSSGAKPPLRAQSLCLSRSTDVWRSGTSFDTPRFAPPSARRTTSFAITRSPPAPASIATPPLPRKSTSYIPPHRRSSISSNAQAPDARLFHAGGRSVPGTDNGRSWRRSFTDTTWRTSAPAVPAAPPPATTAPLARRSCGLQINPPRVSSDHHRDLSPVDPGIVAQSSFFSVARTVPSVPARAPEPLSPQAEDTSSSSPSPPTLLPNTRSQPIPISRDSRDSRRSSLSYAPTAPRTDLETTAEDGAEDDPVPGGNSPAEHTSLESVMGSDSDELLHSQEIPEQPNLAADPSATFFPLSEVGSMQRDASCPLTASCSPPIGIQPLDALLAPSPLPSAAYAFAPPTENTSEATTHARSVLAHVANSLSSSSMPSDHAMSQPATAAGPPALSPAPIRDTSHTAGSFSGALAQLLHARGSSGTPSPTLAGRATPIDVPTPAPAGQPAVVPGLGLLGGYMSPVAEGLRTLPGSSADTPHSPHAAVSSTAALHKLPSELLDELAGSAGDDPSVKTMLASLLYSSPCAITISDASAPDEPIVYVNAIFELKTGYKASEVVGKNCRFLQAPPGRQRKPTFSSIALKRAIGMGRSHTCHLLNFAKDGSPLWNQLSIVPVRAVSGAVTHYIGMQTFSEATPASASDVLLSGDTSIAMPRGASQQCLASLDTSAATLHPRHRSNSYQVLSALTPTLVSGASAALHGCMGLV